MTVHLRPATETDIREFAAWRYPPPYDVYDVTMSAEDAVAYFSDADVRCNALTEGTTVVGYCTFGRDAQVPGGHYHEDGLDVGLGIEPTRTGSGKGHHYVAAVVAHASASFRPKQLRVTIAVGNTRALRVWSSAGFSEISRFRAANEVMGSTGFVILVLELNPPQSATSSSPVHTREGPV